MPLKASLRRLVYQTEKLTQHARFASLPAPENGWPVLLGISFPKSGTHLLDQILQTQDMMLLRQVILL